MVVMVVADVAVDVGLVRQGLLGAIVDGLDLERGGKRTEGWEVNGLDGFGAFVCGEDSHAQGG